MLVSTRDFVTRLSESGLSVMLPPDMAAALLKLPTAEEAARQLIESNLLTEFQARVLADGDNVPLIIGDYVVVGSLGRGGMGYVLKARHRRMKRDVAIKFLLKELTASTDMRRRFEREVEAAAQLNHQNIVTAYDAGEHTDGSCYLVMQFVDGDDLSHLVKANGPLKLPQAIDIICQAAEGLAFAHDKGIVHRDIKPGNLLLDKDGVVRILDMGLARMRPSPGDSIEGGAHADLTNTGSVMGTIDYMAPEQALDAKSADHRADIYSLGCTLWFLLSGNPPYRSDTIMRRLLAHREQQIPSVRSLWPDAPSELDDILKSMMAKSKEDRFPSMRHLIVALRGLDKEDLEVGQMATMDVAEESAFSAKRSKSERFTPPSSPTAPLPLSEQQIKGAKPVLPAAIPADPTVIQNGAASSASETVTFNNNESRVARRPRKKTSRPAGSSRSAVEQAPTKSLVLSKRVALIAGISVLAIALAVALWSTRKPAASTNNTTEIAQSSEGQQPESSSPPAPPPPAIAPFDATQANVHQAAWSELFNGKDLAGWEVMGVKGWSVEQGVLLGKTSMTAGNGWLMSERQFGDFELDLEYKLSPGSNSGIFLRAWPEGDVGGSQFREIQLLDDEHPMFASVPADRRSGSVFGVVAPNPTPKLPADQWHRVRVHLKGQQLQLTINDVAVLKHTLTDLRPSGRIGLQLYPNRVEFRNIRVRPVD